MQRKFHVAIGKTGWPVHYSWAQLANGGETPTYVLLIPHESYANMKGPEKSCGQMLVDAVGAREAEGPHGAALVAAPNIPEEERIMKTALTSIAAAGSSVLLFSCAAPAPKPVVDLAADRAAVEKLIADQLVATNQPGQAGADGYVSITVDDLVLLPPNGARLDGKKAVRDWSLQFTSAPDWHVTWQADHVEVASSGDLAYATGTYELSLKDPNGNAVSDKGKFLDTFKKQPDGSWKQTVISYNSDLPASAPPVPKS